MVQEDDSGHHPVIAPLGLCTFTVLVAGTDSAGRLILANKCFALKVTHITSVSLGMEIQSSPDVIRNFYYIRFFFYQSTRKY